MQITFLVELPLNLPSETVVLNIKRNGDVWKKKSIYESVMLENTDILIILIKYDCNYNISCNVKRASETGDFSAI